jgi:hypothetical protein
MKREELVSKTIDIADRIDRVEPSEDLMRRLQGIPGSIRDTYDKIPKKVVWSVAASIAILITINAFVFSRSKSSDAHSITLEETYFSYMKNV